MSQRARGAVRESWIGVVGAGVAVLALAARPAAACVPPWCPVGAVLPTAQQVPANLPALAWAPLARPVVAQRLALVGSDGVVVPVTVTEGPDGGYDAVPATPLVDGWSYVVSDLTPVPEECASGIPTGTFRASAARPLPTQLGTTELEHLTQATVREATTGGSCFLEALAAIARVRIALAPEARPWSAVLLYQTLVDGVAWAPPPSLDLSQPLGQSFVGRGVDEIYSACPNSNGIVGVAGGVPHQIELIARVPGTTTILHSTPVTVTLACMPPGDAGPGAVSDDGGCQTSQDGGGVVAAAAALLALARRRRR